MCAPSSPHHHQGQSRHDHHQHSSLVVPEVFLSRRRLLRVGGVGLGGALLAACGNGSSNQITGPSTSATPTSPADSLLATTTAAPTNSTLAGFDAFRESVTVTNDGTWWLVESDGMPAHNMMVGITSWQQQVPTPQPYSGTNSWRIRMSPTKAETPVSARTGLYRGAIALAANGVPIFNALNNRGDDAFLVGELDEWGGHAGRADDYHYHVAPLHLQETVGANQPIAFALDGYPVYGETEPDGSAVQTLDEFNGHELPDGTYHYHGTRTYPYINGGLRGVVNVVGDQVDPQPVTRPFREATSPLQGATVTAFERISSESFRLAYLANGAEGGVAYTVGSNSILFTFTDPSGTVTTETYERPS
ncbi:MAG: YHYH protein [Actinobacteria bacterium]|uniref:Unannotated protein n=1 Tax=freshwater metagenome TaxID=449393 RepID=A0A6J7NYX4_9ZZZZ|nr:YHYH protein [Actinomycetota bacterium]MSX79749.1 YHYH protein [Actinomycetota bacterium]